MSIFRARSKYGTLLLGLWLVLTGLRQLVHLDFLLFGNLLGGLAIAAGALILLDR